MLMDDQHHIAMSELTSANIGVEKLLCKNIITSLDKDVFITKIYADLFL